MSLKHLQNVKKKTGFQKKKEQPFVGYNYSQITALKMLTIH